MGKYIHTCLSLWEAHGAPAGIDQLPTKRLSTVLQRCMLKQNPMLDDLVSTAARQCALRHNLKGEMRVSAVPRWWAVRRNLTPVRRQLNTGPGKCALRHDLMYKRLSPGHGECALRHDLTIYRASEHRTSAARVLWQNANRS